MAYIDLIDLLVAYIDPIHLLVAYIDSIGEPQSLPGTPYPYKAKGLQERVFLWPSLLMLTSCIGLAVPNSKTKI